MGLFKSFNKYNKNIAIIDKEYSNLSYKQVLKEINEIKKEIKNRSLILIVSENSLGSLLAYIFCIINNHVGIIIDSNKIVHAFGCVRIDYLNEKGIINSTSKKITHYLFYYVLLV